MEMARVRKGEITFYNLDGDEIEKELKTIDWNAEAAEKAGYEHFMMKEIHEQPKVVGDTINSVVKEDFIDLSNVGLSEEDIKEISQIYIVACGSAYHVGIAAQYVIEDLLGFKVIRENYRKERDDYKIDLACGQQEIELFIIKNAPARVNYPEALGLRHLAFKVESIDDTVKELNGKGIETEPVRLDDYTGKKMTFFHDPDGLPLEIHE